MKKAIIVTGTPGTGKTTFAKKYAKQKKYVYIDALAIIKSKKLFDRYDKKRKCIVVDEQKLAKFFEQMIKSSLKTMVIDSHMSQYINPKYVRLCFVCKTELKKLQQRLVNRKYSKSKIKENLECEIFDVCLNEAKEIGHKIKVIAT